MKGVLLICRYFFTWQLMLCWLRALGLLFLIAVPTIDILNAFNEDIRISTFPFLNPGILGTFAYLFLLAVPFMATPQAFRDMISNSQLSLLPNFRLKAGLSLLLMTAILSLLPYFSLIVITGFNFNDVPSLISLNIFCIASIYTLIFQLTLPSRYFIYLVSYGLIFIVFILGIGGEYIVNYFKDPIHLILLSLSCIAGWIIALVILAKKKTFKPATLSNMDVHQEMFTNPDNAWLGGLNFKNITNAGLTLLTGLPDSLGDRIKRAFMICIVSPLSITLIIMAVSLGRDTDVDALPALPEFFLIFSFMTVSIGTYTFSTLAPRTRYLWLRCGGNRLWQWRNMESSMFSNLGIQFLMLMPACLVLLFLTDFSPLLLSQFILSFIAITALITYLGLAAKINNWPDLILFLLMVSSIVGIILFYFRLIAEAEFLLKSIIDICVFVSALFLRYIAKRGFLHIDWLVIKPIATRRNTIHS